MLSIVINKRNKINQVEIKLEKDSIYLEPAAIEYIHGDITVDTTIKKFKNFLSTYFFSEQSFKPLFSGTGTIYLKSSKNTFFELELNNDNLILEKNTFWAASSSLKIFPETNLSVANKLNGIPASYTVVSGSGKLILQAPGDVQKATVSENNSFTSFNKIIARSSKIKHSRQKLDPYNSSITSLAISDKLVDVYTGDGFVYFVDILNIS